MKSLILLNISVFLCLSANAFQLNPNEESEKLFVGHVVRLLNLESKSIKYFEGRMRVTPKESIGSQLTTHPSTDVKCHAKITNDGANVKLELTTQKYLKKVYTTSYDYKTGKVTELNPPRSTFSGGNITRQSIVNYDYNRLSSYSVDVASDSSSVVRKQYKANLADQTASSESISLEDGLTIKADSFQTAFFIVPFNTDTNDARFFNCSQMKEISEEQFKRNSTAVIEVLQ